MVYLSMWQVLFKTNDFVNKPIWLYEEYSLSVEFIDLHEYSNPGVTQIRACIIMRVHINKRRKIECYFLDWEKYAGISF